MAIEIYYQTHDDEDIRCFQGGIPGSLQTWMAFMLHMERKYLPSLTSAYPLEERNPSYHSRLALSSSYSRYLIQEIWDLQLSPQITKNERIVMLSMMDGAYFLPDHCPDIFNAWIEVAQEIGPKSEAAFLGLIDACMKLINESTADNYPQNLYVNWNSVGQLSTDKLFNVMDDFDRIEAGFMK